MSAILTTILGIVGAFVATYLGQALGWYQQARVLVSSVRPLGRSSCSRFGELSLAGRAAPLPKEGYRNRRDGEP